MSQAQLQASIQLAEQWSRRLRDITKSLGTKDFPDGRMVVAYRNAKRAMTQVLSQSTEPQQRIFGAVEVMTELRQSIRTSAIEALDTGVEIGRDMIGGNAGIYELPYTPEEPLPTITATLIAALDIVGAHLLRQDAYVRALIFAEAEDAEIIGDATSPGVFNPSGPVRDTDHWAADVAANTFGLLLFGILANMGPRAPVFEKIASAIRDLRTTETCQNVDGQHVPVDEPFDLDGWSPAYADEMMWPPFHGFCRTGVALGRIEDIDLGFGAQTPLEPIV